MLPSCYITLFQRLHHTSTFSFRSCALFISFTLLISLFFFFFNDTATTEIYTLSLHDALPISLATAAPGRNRGWKSFCPGRASPAPLRASARPPRGPSPWRARRGNPRSAPGGDRKSTRLNSSHGYISYAVFCLKKKNKNHCRAQ